MQLTIRAAKLHKEKGNSMKNLMRRKWLVLSFAAVFAAGCFTAAQWFTLIGDLLPIVTQTFLGMSSAVNGGSVPAAEVTAVDNLSQQGQDILSKIGALVQTASTANAAGTAGQIQALITQLQGDVNGFLTDVSIKNSSRFAEYEAVANVLLADASDIAGLVPIFSSSSSANLTVVKQMTSARYHKAKALKGIFQERLALVPKRF